MKYVVEERKSRSTRGGRILESEPHDRDWTLLVTLTRLANRLRIKLRIDELGKNKVRAMQVPARMAGDGIRLTLPPLDGFTEIKTICLPLDEQRTLVARFDRPINLFAGVHNDITLHAVDRDLEGVHPSVVRSSSAELPNKY